MSTTNNNPFALIPAEADSITGVGRAELQEYINQKYKDVPMPVLANFLYVCYVRNLNPLLNHVYIVPIGGKLQLVTGIDSYRLIAQRTGQYAGKKAPLYLKESGKWEDFVLEGEKILAGRITIMKQMQGGVIVETTCDAYMKEYNKGINQWKSMPYHMIAKVAESLALRTAFPDELAGLYTAEEVEELGTEEVKTVDYLEKAKEFVDSIAKDIPSEYWAKMKDHLICDSEKKLKDVKDVVYTNAYEIAYRNCQDETKKEAFKKWFMLNASYSQKNMETVIGAYIRFSKPTNVLVYDMEQVKAIVDTLEGMESQTERIDFVKGIDQHYKAHPDVKEVLSKYSLSDGN